MTTINTKTRKWGNSVGIVLPNKVILDENIEENQDIKILIVRDSNVLYKTFGLLKGKIKKTSQELKDNSREELYPEKDGLLL